MWFLCCFLQLSNPPSNSLFVLHYIFLSMSVTTSRCCNSQGMAFTFSSEGVGWELLYVLVVHPEQLLYWRNLQQLDNLAFTFFKYFLLYLPTNTKSISVSFPPIQGYFSLFLLFKPCICYAQILFITKILFT